MDAQATMTKQRIENLFISTDNFETSLLRPLYRDQSKKKPGVVNACAEHAESGKIGTLTYLP